MDINEKLVEFDIDIKRLQFRKLNVKEAFTFVFKEEKWYLKMMPVLVVCFFVGIIVKIITMMTSGGSLAGATPLVPLGASGVSVGIFAVTLIGIFATIAATAIAVIIVNFILILYVAGYSFRVAHNVMKQKETFLPTWSLFNILGYIGNGISYLIVLMMMSPILILALFLAPAIFTLYCRRLSFWDMFRYPTMYHLIKNNLIEYLVILIISAVMIFLICLITSSFIGCLILPFVFLYCLMSLGHMGAQIYSNYEMQTCNNALAM